MATYATSAIVIGRHNFGEADRIIILLTPEKGVIRAVAKGVRRIKSRMAGHLELFSESSLMLAKGRNMDVITSARLTNHVSIADSYERMRLAYLFAEMVVKLGADEEHHEGLFDVLKEAYGVLGRGEEAPLLELWFKLRLLDRLGYRPDVWACVVCGASDADREYLFNAELGGIVDKGCSQPGNQPMSHDQIKLWRLILSKPYKPLSETAGINQLAVSTLPICNQFYDYTFGKRFRSAEVLT